MSRLLHYSPTPLTKVLDTPQGGTHLDGNRRSQFKPLGLWLSVEGADDWLSWVSYNWPGWMDDVEHTTEVVLAPDANILTLATAEDVAQLGERFPGRGSRLDVMVSFGAPDWSAIAEAYDGLMIAPYQWSQRLSLDAQWYYTWDAASACIWSARAVARLVPVGGRPALTADVEVA